MVAAHDVDEVCRKSQVLREGVVVHRHEDIDARLSGEPRGLAVIQVPDYTGRLAEVIAAIDRKERDISAERAQALRLAVVHDRVAGVVNTGDPVIENIAEIAVEPVRELAPEGVGFGHSHSVPRGYRMKRL